MTMTIHLGWPQILYLALLAIGIGYSLAHYGKPKTGVHDLSDVLISPIIISFLLWWGGFFG